MGIKGIGNMTGNGDDEQPNIPTREEQEKVIKEQEKEKIEAHKLHNEKRISPERRDAQKSS